MMLIIEIILMLIGIALVVRYKDNFFKKPYVLFVLLLVGLAGLHYATVKLLFSHSLLLEHNRQLLGSVAEIKQVSAPGVVDSALKIVDVDSQATRYVLAVDDSLQIVTKGVDYDLKTAHLRYLSKTSLCLRGADKCVPIIYMGEVK